MSGNHSVLKSAPAGRRPGHRALLLLACLVGLAGCAVDFPPPAQGPDGALDAARADARAGTVDATLPPPADEDLPDQPLDPDRGTAPPPDLGGGGDQDPPDGDAPLPPDAASLCEPERCNNLDDDCDGRIDENFPSKGAPCTEGIGACRVDGQLACTEAGDGVACDATAGEPSAERCDGRDSDCDGLIDNLPATPCVLAPDTACEAPGAIACSGNQPICLGEAGEPSRERCNTGLDEDCDGTIDEGGDEPCSVGLGQCATPGRLSCEGVEPGGAPRCAGEPLPAQAEACDGLDNDCDGLIDEAAAFQGECSRGQGVCRRSGSLTCPPGGGALGCDAVPGPPTLETCDGLDNDCDGATDEDFGVGQACLAGQGACARPGQRVCDAAAPDQTRCDAAPGDPTPEQCNGLDDDCDGRIDEAEPGQLSPCGDWIAGRCRIWLGWVDNLPDPGALGVRGDWGACPARPAERGNALGCTSTRGTQRFHSVMVRGAMDDNDWLALRFECDAEGPGPWIDRHCQLALGYQDGGNGDSVRNLDPTACALVAPSTAGQPRCVRTGGDRQFHPLQTQGRVDGNDNFGIAFACRDPADPERAAQVEAAVEVFLGLRNRSTGWDFEGCTLTNSRWDDRDTWDDCPGDLSETGGRERCVGRAGGTGFDVVRPDNRVETCDEVAVALLRARAR